MKIVYAALSITALAMGGWLYWLDLPAQKAVTPPNIAPRSVAAVVSQWPNEEAWIIDMTTQHLAQLAGVVLDEVSVSSTPHIWAIEAYIPLAETLGIGTDSGEEGRQMLLRELLSPGAVNLQRINIEVSSNLEQNPHSVAAHEDAAMLLASFALKDGAGGFYDTRAALSRLCAHLVMASVLRGDAQPGATGRLASILLEVLAGRGKRANELIEAHLSEASEEQAIWRRVALMRVHSDWRLAEDDFDQGLLSELETIEYLRAVRRRIDDSLVLEKLQTMDLRPPLADWSRIFVNENSYYRNSVGSGRFIMEYGIAAELAEASAVFGLSEEADKFSVEAFQDRVKHPDPSTESRVITEAMWADHVERHLLQTCVTAAKFLEVQLGDPEAHSAFLRGTRPLLESLPRFAVVGAEWQKWDKQKTFDFVHKNPEKVPVQAWVDWSGRPGAKDWFVRNLPSGTAYNNIQRRALFASGKAWLDTMHAIYELAPTCPYACFQLAASDADKFNNIEELYGDYLDASSSGLNIAATKAGWQDQGLYLDYIRRGAVLDPQMYLKVGRLSAISGDREQAAEAYRKAYEEGADRVSVSQQMSWYVLDLLDQGNKPEAFRVANEMAEVYSYGGLRLMMWYYAKEGDFVKAFDFAERIQERYDYNKQWTELWGRYPAEVARQPQSGALVERAKVFYDEVFPNGRKNYDPAMESSAPDAGVRVMEASDRNAHSPYLAFYGLRHGDIVIAVDGFRIENQKQYLAIRDANYFQKSHAVVVWRNGKYLKLEKDLPNRKFGCKLQDWRLQ